MLLKTKKADLMDIKGKIWYLCIEIGKQIIKEPITFY